MRTMLVLILSGSLPSRSTIPIEREAKGQEPNDNADSSEGRVIFWEEDHCSSCGQVRYPEYCEERIDHLSIRSDEGGNQIEDETTKYLADTFSVHVVPCSGDIGLIRGSVYKQDESERGPIVYSACACSIATPRVCRVEAYRSWNWAHHSGFWRLISSER